MWIIVQKNTITSATYITCSIMPECLFKKKYSFFVFETDYHYENPHLLGLGLCKCTLWLHDLPPGQDQNQSYTQAPFEGLESCWLWKTIGWLHHPSNLPKHDKITKFSRKKHRCVELRHAISHLPGFPPAASTRVSDQSTACIILQWDHQMKKTNTARCTFHQ